MRKGFEEINTAANKVSFDKLEQSINAIQNRFSTMGIVGMRVIENLTDKAMMLVSKIRSFVTDGIVSGGIRRATNLENAQFQLQGLLNDAEAVEAVMKNVNDAVDGTAYSLDAAATVASQLAASGMKAGDEMFSALRGVAGVAAMTNSSYEDIGRIYTQVAGQGKLMGDQLLQLSGRGMNAAATLAKYLNKSEAEVREMTSKGEIDFKTFASAMDNAFGEHAKKANDTVANALKIVENLEHRAGKDAEGKTGDGVGILLQISHKFFKKVCKKEGFDIGGEREYGVAQLFFPQQEIKRAQAKKMFEIIVEKEGLELLGWRTVPVFPEVLGHKAKECMPCIMQAFVKKPEDVEKGLAFDRMLYIARREFEQSNDNTYVVSMNSRTIVYKGMFLVGQLRTFFGDLQSQDYESAIAVVHSRFSTNTNPSWERAHPNRFIRTITVRSIRSAATPTRCLHVRKTWSLRI